MPLSAADQLDLQDALDQLTSVDWSYGDGTTSQACDRQEACHGQIL